MDLDLNRNAKYNQIWQDQYSVFKVTSSCWFCMISLRNDNFIACHLCQNYKFFIAIKNAHIDYRQISILNQFYRLWVLRICAFQDSADLCFLLANQYAISDSELLCHTQAKIQQTKMLVRCQRFGDWFLFGLVWPHTTYCWNIKWQKCARIGLNGFHIR